ncbi:Ca-activated chloride channel family protein [Pseudaminobacter salicylatoxidans]|uniref:Ca-activated chloride channel family protein n=1 Tax=Pseudaminobacter salicylatoxidans TaxID=93369 RepID=A0A316C1X9_PSESE|nr:VWA domain-containing protein [Pseudaminobacter salicylatoxidans]PWJ83739.1 Ca-activated chloride channel family protein [Pseudaminobacter salicylatoxidans]
MKILKATLVAATAVTMSFSGASAAEDVVIVYDASGSMWGQIDGTSKIEIAREVMADLVTGWSADINLGLVAYGHRSEGDCRDIETLIEPGPLDRANFIKKVNGIQPRGKTPISAAVQHAADLLSYRDNPATVVLISDGLETCQADPCALAGQLAQQGVKFTTHVVGFDLDDKAHASLACIAENTGGVFVPAQNAAELKDALAHVQSVMDLQPMVQQEGEATPEPEQQTAEIEVQAPATVITGASFAVTYSDNLHANDFVTIVPAGADEGSEGRYFRVGDKNEGALVAPATPGLYEVRYVQSQGHNTLGSTPIEVVEAELGIAAPEQVTTGTSFKVTWSSSIHPQDFVTIVPVGSDEGTEARYFRVGENTENSLVAPAEPGLYEVRYVLNNGRRTMASTPVEVIEAEMAIAAPEQVTTGASFKVTWSSSIHPQDFVTIVPAGSDEGTEARYFRVGENTENSLVAPAEPGLYEVRYVLNNGRRTMAFTPVEVVGAEVTLSAPDVLRAGSEMRMSWSSSIHPQDFITIVPAGAGQGAEGKYLRVRDNTDGKLVGPTETGFYELRYILNEGARIMATHSFEVVPANAPLDEGAGLNAPAQAGVGETITVSWTAEAGSADQRVSVARADQADFSWIAAHKVGAEKVLELQMPAEAGAYEVRFLDISGRKVLGRSIVEVK